MKLRIGLCVTLCSAVAVAADTPAPAPRVKAGETWTYRDTTEKGPTGWQQTRDEITVSRVTASSIYYTSKPSGSTQSPRDTFAGIDWSRIRDLDGKETVVNRPLVFPLAPGKTWEVEYTEQHPNKTFKSQHWQQKYAVVGYEEVQVPAGKFLAIKVEEEGHWSAELEPTRTVAQGAEVSASASTTVTQTEQTRSGPTSGRTYKAFWYVPDVKRWVKSVEEYYGSGGVRNERYTGELESFKIDP